MDSRSDVMIVSVYGRGHWLAVDLANRGFSVTLADVTGTMGRWSPDDWENPFGYFRMDGYEGYQTARLIEDAALERVDNGFCVWSKNGIVETYGSLNPYQLVKANVSKEVRDYLYSSTHKSFSVDSKKFKLIKDQEFKNTWLARLSHQICSTVDCEAIDALDYGYPLPIFAEHSLRRTTRDSLGKSLNWCQKNGVKVLENAKLSDLFLEGKTIGGAEIKADGSGITRAKYMVWTLTSEETQRLPESVSNLLFSSGHISNSWSWTRFRMKINSDYYSELLPIHFVMIEDLFVPWFGVNAVIMQKTVNKNQFDAWLKIPTSQRFLKPYLESVSDEIAQLLKNRLPDCEVKIEEYPQDYHYDYTEMGAVPLPVYNEAQLNKLRNRQIKNFYYDGPEHWDNLDWGGQFRYQESIRNDIVADRDREARKNQ